MTKRLRSITVIGAAILACTAGVAWAATASITNDPNANLFLPPTYSHDPGTVATYTHSGQSTHDVTATASGPDGKALFRSATISSGATPVNGTEFLPPGSYSFFCTVHGPSMAGILNVNPGTPLARPTVAVKVVSKKIEGVLDSGKLIAKVTTTAPSVTLTAKLGAKTIGLGGGAGGTRKLKLTKSGKKALAKKKTAKVAVTAEIDFGAPVTVVAKLK